MNRPGVSLLIVMGVLVIAGTLALSASADGTDASMASDNRAMITQASWRAQGCAAVAVAHLDAAMRAAIPGDVRDALWRHLDRAAPVTLGDDYPDCRVTLQSAESRLDLNAAPEDAIRAYFAARFSEIDAGRAGDAVLDWRDSDDDARDDGAEGAWYRERGRIGPRNGAFRSLAELRLVRGLETDGITNDELAIEGGFLIDLMNAPPTVLRSIPGFSPAVVTALMRLRAEGSDLSDVRELVGLVPSELAPEMSQSYELLSSVVLLTPRSWLLEATVLAPRRAVSRTEQWRIGRGPGHLVVTGRRVW